MKTLLFIAIVASVFSSYITSAQQAHTFENFYNTNPPDDDQGGYTSVIQLKDGGFLATGYGDFLIGNTTYFDIELSRIQEDGSVVWRTCIYSDSSHVPYPRKIKWYNDSTIVIGCQTSDLNYTDYYSLVVMADTAGNIKWAKQYTIANDPTALWDLEVLKNGNLVFSTNDPFGGATNLTALDSAGNVLWCDNSSEIFTSITSDGQHIYCCGGNALNCFVSKISFDGNQVWGKTIAVDSMVSFWSVSLGPDKEIYLGGDYFTPLSFFPFVIKTDSDGNFEWANYYETPTACAEIFSVYSTPDFGAIHILEMEGMMEKGNWINPTGLCKLRSDGSVEWAKAYNYQNYMFPLYTQQNIDGGFCVVGRTSYVSEVTPYQEAGFIVKTDEHGSTICGADTPLVISVHPKTQVSVGTLSLKAENHVVAEPIVLSQSNPNLSPFILCTDTFSIVNNILQIKDSETPKLIVYPNPFVDKTNFEFEASRSYISVLKIYSLLGELVFKTSLINADNYQFIGNNLSSGIYFYEIDTYNNKKLMGKIIKQ